MPTVIRSGSGKVPADMRSGKSLLVSLLTGFAVLATTAAAGLLTGNPLAAVGVAVAWAGVLAWRHGRSSEGDGSDSARAEDASVRYRQR